MIDQKNQQGCITVCCRVRPLSSSERSNSNIVNIIKCLDRSVIIEPTVQMSQKFFGLKASAPRIRSFSFDKVFHDQCNQEDVYSGSCSNVVKGLFEGINGSILTYGVTGSGKTYTMFGSKLSAPGVAFQCIQHIFEQKALMEETMEKTVNISCSFVEIYNEEIFDLLAESRTKKKTSPLLAVENSGLTKKNADLKSDYNPEGICLMGVVKRPIVTLDQFDSVVEFGVRNRATSATNCNIYSSRSHAILTIEVEICNNENELSATCARIRLCDLAGSERSSATSTGINSKHQREGGIINKSLLSFGTVIQSLVRRSKAKSTELAANIYVPYRSSKLTRLLKDSVSGNCATTIIFCISPSSNTFNDTANTLSFAMHAKMVKISAKTTGYRLKPSQLVKTQENIIQALRTEISELRAELKKKHDCHAVTAEKRVPLADVKVNTCPSRARSSSLSGQHNFGSLEPEVWMELQSRVRKAIARKVETHRKLQESNSTRENLDMFIRHAWWEFIRCLTPVDDKGQLELPSPPPVSIHGLLASVEANLAKQSEVKEASEVVLQEQNVIDEEVNTVTAQMRRERNNNALVEMLLENANLRFSALDAEVLATEYSLSSFAADMRIVEYREALSQCVPLLRELLPLARVHDEERARSLDRHINDAEIDCSSNKPGALSRRCQIALAYAQVPLSSTTQILESFKKLLNVSVKENNMISSESTTPEKLRKRTDSGSTFMRRSSLQLYSDRKYNAFPSLRSSALIAPLLSPNKQ